MTIQRVPVICAPGGSRAAVSAALDAGADVIYTGVQGLNMRRAAEPFTARDIREFTARAHDRGAALALALNIVVYDNEHGLVAHTLDMAADAGVDAIICWDPGVILPARERGLTVHLSTQASVSNTAAVRFYESLGVSRIVLARELSLEQIAAIVHDTDRRKSPVTFECFVHGAMCVAVSGRCFMSLLNHGRSANRGDCLQPCRRRYRVYDSDDDGEFILDGHTVMSAKDLSTIDILDRIMATGVTALKIEGRMRDARYVGTTVAAYREARDAVLAGVYTPALAERLAHDLERVFHRGFSHGFYTGRPDSDISEGDGNLSSVVRAYAGRVVNYYRQAGAADIQLEARGIDAGDTVLITGPTTGALEFTAESLRSEDDRPIETASGIDLIGLAVPGKVRVGDRVFVILPRTE